MEFPMQFPVYVSSKLFAQHVIGRGITNLFIFMCILPKKRLIPLNGTFLK